MKLSHLLTGSFFAAIAIGCKSPKLEGRYVCDKSLVKADTTIHHSDHDEVNIDITCMVSELVFSGKNTVSLQSSNGPYTTTYTIDDSIVHIAGTGGGLSVTIKDENTIMGTGVIQGVYHKQ